MCLMGGHRRYRSHLTTVSNKGFHFCFLKQLWNLHLCCREKMGHLIPSPKYFNFKIYSEEQSLIPDLYFDRVCILVDI